LVGAIRTPCRAFNQHISFSKEKLRKKRGKREERKKKGKRKKGERWGSTHGARDSIGFFFAKAARKKRGVCRETRQRREERKKKKMVTLTRLFEVNFLIYLRGGKSTRKKGRGKKKEKKKRRGKKGGERTVRVIRTRFRLFLLRIMTSSPETKRKTKEKKKGKLPPF